MGKLKKQGGYFNRQKQTLAGLLGEGDPEEAMSLSDRLMWGGMRMDPTDIADVTGFTYTYHINGHGPAENWTAPIRPDASSRTTTRTRITPGARSRKRNRGGQADCRDAGAATG